jgi:ABC-2 type transport system permease protein
VSVRLFLHELRAQQRLFWTQPEAAFFTFLLPIIFLVLLGAVYGDSTIDGVNGSTFLLAGMIGYGIAASAFAGLAITTVIRRESGVLKRVRGTPMPGHLYLVAVIASTLLVIAIQVVLQLLIGGFALDAGWPAAPGSFVAALLIGAAAFAALGLALSAVVKSAEGSSAVVNAIYLPMTFVSGAFFSPESMPDFLEAVSNVLPLTFLLRLLRESFVEGATIGANWGDVVALALWGLAGLAIAARCFRWEPREA